MDDYRRRKIETSEGGIVEGIKSSAVGKKPCVRVRDDCVEQNSPPSSNCSDSPPREENEDSGGEDDRPMSTEDGVEENIKSESGDNSDAEEAATSLATSKEGEAVSGTALLPPDDGLVLSDLLSKKVILANGELAYRINSQRCKAQLGYRGYMYAPVSQIRGSHVVRWRCLNARNNCSAHVTTDKDFTEVTIGPNMHGAYCSPDEIGVRLKAAINDIKISAEFWTGPLRDLYKEFTDSLARTDPQVLSVFPTVEIHALLKSMSNHRVSQICRKQFLLDRKETERREKITAITRKRKLAEVEKKRLFPETICCECGEVVGDQNNLITHLQTVHDRTDLKIESFEFANRDEFTAWLKFVYGQMAHKLNQFGTYDMAAYYLCLKDDRLKLPTSIGVHCSAFIKARMGGFSDAHKVKVDYCLQHTFHANDVGSSEDPVKLAALAPAEVLKHMKEQDERKRRFVEQLIKSGRCQRIQRVAGNQLFPRQKATESSTSVNDVTPSTSYHSVDDADDAFKSWKRSRQYNVPLLASTRQPSVGRFFLNPTDLKATPLDPQKQKVDDGFLSGLITQIDMECDLIQTRSLRLTTTKAAENCLGFLAQARAALIEDPGCRRYLPRAGDRSQSPIKTARAVAKSSPSAPSTATRSVPVGWTAVRPQVGLRVPVPSSKRNAPAQNSLTPAASTTTDAEPPAAGTQLTRTQKSNDKKAPVENTKAVEGPPKLDPTTAPIKGPRPSARIAVNAGLVASALRGNLKLVRAAPPGKSFRTISTPAQSTQCCECDVKHESPLLVMMRCRQCRLVYHKQCAHTCKK
uniref:C2H2-type domain-containing protein n=1 Tax=Plectus sambesii TaxID=2011161 RepID=A0A914WWI6_9BILA